MKHFLNLKEIPKKKLRSILSDAKKRKKYRENFNNLDLDKTELLNGKIIIQIFDKPSLRTRLSFYLAVKQLGAGIITVKNDELHFAKGEESIADTAKILSNYADGIILRSNSDKKMEEFSRYLNIPLINGLTPSSHPVQILSDIFTIEEIKKKPIAKLKICWIGDSNNVLNSLMEASVKFSFKLNIACPKNYSPNNKFFSWVKRNNKYVLVYNDPLKAARDVDVIMSDKVISLNDKVNKKNKIKDFKKFKINKQIIKVAKKDAIFLHCLPRGNEVSEDVFSSNQSKVWLQAINRTHVQKSILLYCFDKLR